ncbi:hypothetical protein [Streptomyces millisiae]|uniref:Uncharacterized protein n=1 Tax=Streptomyces millisiae TaxID=3075542 RepID=A0ABU2LKW4_9ACTN|nr:hypothetical protein [Streptomyces sp. DSM 44918]MDT0318216.1 hypothetical protein [Streptomyces sp. DSM 44918]
MDLAMSLLRSGWIHAGESSDFIATRLEVTQQANAFALQWIEGERYAAGT